VHPRQAVALALSAIAAFPHHSSAQSRLQRRRSGTRQAVVDSSEISHRARDLQARFESRRRHMLPRFYAGPAERCLIIGRFVRVASKPRDYVVPMRGTTSVARAPSSCVIWRGQGNAVPGGRLDRRPAHPLPGRGTRQLRDQRCPLVQSHEMWRLCSPRGGEFVDVRPA